MPISASQHRTLIATHLNQTQDKARKNQTIRQLISSNHSNLNNQRCILGAKINQIANSHENLKHSSFKYRSAPLNIAAPLILLLSQIRFADSATLATPTETLSKNEN